MPDITHSDLNFLFEQYRRTRAQRDAAVAEMLRYARLIELIKKPKRKRVKNDLQG